MSKITLKAQRDVLAAILAQEVGCPDDVKLFDGEQPDWCCLKWSSNGEPLGCANDDPGECWLQYAAQEAAKQEECEE
jgi:hypothetical protein